MIAEDRLRRLGLPSLDVRMAGRMLVGFAHVSCMGRTDVYVYGDAGSSRFLTEWLEVALHTYIAG